MNLFKWLVSLLSLCCLVTSYANPQSPETCQPVAELGNLTGITLNYQLGHDKKDAITVTFCFAQLMLTPAHISLLEKLEKTLILKLSTQSQPIDFSSNISVLSTSNELPSVSILSFIGKIYKDEKGTIQSEMLIPQYQQEIAETEERVSINFDWAGAIAKSRYTPTDLWLQIATALTAGKPVTTEMLKGQSIILDSYKDIEIEMMMPKLSFKLGDRFNLLVESLKYNGLYKDILSPNKLDLTISTIRIGTDEIQLKIKGLDLKNIINITTSGLEMADVNLGIEQSIIENNGIQLNQLTLQSRGEEKGDIVNGFINTELRELVLPETILGKTYQINYQGNFVLRQLDTGSLKKFQDKFKELQRQQYSMRPISEEMMGMVIIGQLMQALPKLWEKSPEFAVDHLQIEMDGGKLIGKGYIGIDGSKPLSINDFDKIKAALKAKAEIVVDEAILKILLNQQGYASDSGVEAEIDDLVDQGKLIALDKKRYQITLSLQAGKLLLNGQPSEWDF